MKILYSNKPVDTDDFDKDVSFANPDYFEAPNTNADEVAIIGDYPDIVQAYKDLKIDVKVLDDDVEDLDDARVLKIAEYIIKNEIKKLTTADAIKAGLDATGDEIKQAFASLK